MLWQSVIRSPRLLFLLIALAAVTEIADAQIPLLNYQRNILENYGRTFSAAGDIDGDLAGDLIIGTPTYTTSSAVPYAGRIEVFSGRTGTLLYSIEGTSADDRLGSSVSSIGDIDNDGRDDFLSGSTECTYLTRPCRAGSVTAYSGRTGLVIYRVSAFQSGSSEYFGSALARLSDIDRDGVDDFLVGAPEPRLFSSMLYPGYVELYSGRTGTLLYRVMGSAFGDLFGSTISRAGDINGDTYEDFVVGAPASSISAPGAGAISVHSGFDGSLLFSHSSTNIGERFGTSVSGGGLLDLQDTVPDIIVGSAGGDIYLYSGTGPLLTIMNSSLPDNAYGSSVSMVGDLDFDTLSEVVIGAPAIEGIQSPAAEDFVFLYSAADLNTPLQTIRRDQFSGAGAFTAPAGDLNGDGFPDFGFTSHGSVETFSGLTLVPLALVGRGCMFTSSPGSAPAIFNVTPAVVGSQWDLYGSAPAPNVTGQVFISFIPRLPTQLNASCYAYLDSGSFGTLGNFQTDQQGNFHFTVPIPNIPALVGYNVAVQAMVAGGLTNAVYLQLS